MLSRRTYGGQTCLSGRIAIKPVGRCSRDMLAGAWSYHGLKGYIFFGAGSYRVPVRFFCPPEATLDTP